MTKLNSLECRICGREFKSYNSLGVHIARIHRFSTKKYYDEFYKKEIDGICECGKQTNFKNLNKGYNFFCSNPKCKQNSIITKEKRKQTNLDRFGVENAFQSEICKEKSRKTCLKKYGVENVAHNKIFREKSTRTRLEKYGDKSYNNPEKNKQTCLRNYGVDCPFKSDIIKEKIKNINLKRYGVKNPFQAKEIKEKIKQTCLRKYGVEYSSQSEQAKEKSKQTCLRKYGVLYTSQSQNKKEKSKITCLERYGVENAFQNKNIRDKYKKTCLERYGVEYYCLLNSNTTSKDQLKIFNIIKNKYPHSKLNHPILGIYPDIFIPEINTIVEFFGDYYHANPIKYNKDSYIQKCRMSAKEIWFRDENRIKLLESNGYTVKIIWESDWKMNKEKSIESLEI